MILLDAIKRHCESCLQNAGTYSTASLRAIFFFKSLKLVEDKKCFDWQDSQRVNLEMKKYRLQNVGELGAPVLPT